MTKKEIAKKFDILFANQLNFLRLSHEKGYADEEGERYELATIVRAARLFDVIDDHQFHILNNNVWQLYFRG